MNETNDKPEHLEEIRDIIFGPQKRDFEKRVREIQTHLEGARTQFAQMIEALNASLLNELRTLSRQLDEKLKHSDERSNTSRLELLQYAQQLETRFTTSLQSAIQTSAERIASLDLLLKQSGETLGVKLQEHEKRAEAAGTRILERVQEVRSSFIQLLNNAQETAKEQHAELEQQLKRFDERAVVERNEFLKQLEQFETRFDKSVQNAVQTAAEKIGALDVQVNSNQKKLHQEISDLRAELMQTLDKRTHELANSKVSRDAMAETLMELAKRVKGEERTDLKLISQTNKS